MTTNAPYIVLHRMGYWDEALESLPEDAAEPRAEILVDRFFWRLDQAEQARDAVAAIERDAPPLAAFLGAELAYSRQLFGLASAPTDRGRARDGFTAALADERLSGWAMFWLGVVADNLDADPESASNAYDQALAIALDRDDPLLESYALRHQGAHLVEHDKEAGIMLLRRSYHLRAALGARPQTAAAAVVLADALSPGAEADALRHAAARTARELRLTWLLRDDAD